MVLLMCRVNKKSKLERSNCTYLCSLSMYNLHNTESCSTTPTVLRRYRVY